MDTLTYPYEGAYPALIEALPGWSVTLDGGDIEVWNQKGHGEHITVILFRDAGLWQASVNARTCSYSPRTYDGLDPVAVADAVRDIVAVARRAEASVSVPIPDGGAMMPLY